MRVLYAGFVAASEPLPTFVPPMLLSTTAEVPTHRSWALEVKWDGMRAQLRFDGRVTLRSRPGRECGVQFPELQAIADVLPAQALFDGELVCFDADGVPTSSGCGRECEPEPPPQSDAHGRARTRR